MTDNKRGIADLSNALATKSGIKANAADQFVRLFFETIYTYVLQDKQVRVKGLGTFKLVEVQDRESVNVNTGERFLIHGHSKVSFTPENSLRDRINKPFADFQTVVINPNTPIEEMERLADKEETETPVIPLEEEIDGIENNEAESQVDSPEVSSENEETADGAAAPEPVVLEPTNNVIEEPTNKIEASEETTENVELITEEEVTTTCIQPEEHKDILDDTTALSEENIPSERIEEKLPDEGNDEKKRATHSDRQWWKWILGTAAILILIMFSFYMGRISNRQELKEAKEISKPVEPTVQNKTTKKDSVRADSIQTKDVAPTLTDETETSPNLTAEQLREKADAHQQVPYGRYLIVGTKGEYVMKPGDQLYKLARQEYGGNEFAAYIIVHNNFPDKDNIPVGYHVRLPELVLKSSN